MKKECKKVLRKRKKKDRSEKDASKEHTGEAWRKRTTKGRRAGVISIPDMLSLKLQIKVNFS